MATLPSGTVTFLFTDIEGSTRLWERDREAMAAAVDRHFALLRTAIETSGGALYKVVGDAVQAAFPTAAAGLLAAVAAQHSLSAEEWPESIGPLRVRMALHAGEAKPVADDYLAPALNRLARLLGAGHGGQILLTGAVRGLLGEAGRIAPIRLHDLGEHRLRDLLEPEQIWQATAPGLPEIFPPLVTPTAHIAHLPLQPTEVIGREREVRDIRALYAAGQTRLVTVTGPGGTGKTRLAVEVAAGSHDLAPDGAVFVDLAPVTDAALVPSVIAGSLGLREEGSRDARETLVDYLASKTLLLILDNLEQIRPGAAVSQLVAGLVSACPTLRILATSRAPLKIRAEREYPLPPLPIPGPSPGLPLAEMAENPAVQLFVARARAAKPAFDLTTDNAAAVAEICRRLDGLPLAIELAAARIRALGPTDLARRLGNQLDLLTGGAGDRPDRQQTIRGTIAWSYDLLPSAEQALFRRLAVFAGGWTLEMAEALACEPTPLPLDALDGLTVLVEQSLVRVDETPRTTRYSMLETLRAYGQEALARAQEIDGVRTAHVAITLAAMKTGGAGLRGSEPTRWVQALEAEHDNLRTALTWAGAHDQAASIALAAASWPFWETRGYLSEGRMWLAQALALPADTPTPDRAEALLGAGVLARLQGDLTAADSMLEQGLAMWRQLGDPGGESRALRALGVVADLKGDESQAKDLLEQSLEMAREANDAMGIAVSLNSLGVVLWNTGEIDAARAVWEESLTLERGAGQWARLPVPLTNLAVIAIEAGELGQARAYLEEALAIDRELGRLSGVADTLENLGAIAYDEGNIAEAARQHAESLRIRQDLGDRVSVAYSLESIAADAGAAGLCEASARLYGAAAALRDETGAPLPHSELGRYERGLALARAGVDETAFVTAWEAGGRWSWMQAAEEAAAVAQRIAAPATPGEPHDLLIP